MSEQPQPQRMQQTMPEDGGGWHHVNAGPHLHIMFHPNRQLLGREPDDIVRPSIVVAVAGKREQALRFDPFSVGSHYHSVRLKKTVWRRSSMTPTWPAPRGRSGNSTPPQATRPPLDGSEQARGGRGKQLTG